MLKTGRLTVIVAVAVACCAVSAPADDLAQNPTWGIPTADEIRGRLIQWLVERQTEPAVQEKAAAQWSENLAGNEHDLLDRACATIALAEPRALKVIDTCARGANPGELADFEWLAAEQTPAIVGNNLRLLVGRSLVRGQYFDEALQQLEDLKTTDVLDPAALLFYRAVAHHRLIQKKPGLEAIDRLLENRDAIPRRYAVLANLMRADLSQIKDGSLDDISRRMKDVERRLSLGRATKRVRDVEDEVITMLDKLIKELEDKQNQQSQAAAGGIQSSSPAPDSVPMAGKGPGRVTKKNFGKASGWGELPPKEREETMQEIGRDFPAHYREVIEEYFRELAKQNR